MAQLGIVAILYAMPIMSGKGEPYVVPLSGDIVAPGLDAQNRDCQRAGPISQLVARIGCGG